MPVQNASRHPCKSQVKDAFSAAAEYDSSARVQRRAAQRLADRIGDLELPVNANICELGCGTGFLGLALGRRLPGVAWLATDLSPEMVRRARAALERDRRFDFAVIDAEHPEPLKITAPFDLICSTFAAQWFSDIERVLTGLTRYLKPGGRILVTTLTQGTFEEWRRAHTEIGLTPGVPMFPPLDALQRLRPSGRAVQVDVYKDSEAFESGRDFLTSLRSVGATTPQRDHLVLGPGDMRQVLRRFEQLGCVVTYEIATLELQVEGTGH